MTRVAFYAPLKSPNHPTPSGDRQVARNLIDGLRIGLSAEVELVSELRCFEPEGSAPAQDALVAQADTEIARLSAGPRPDIWVSYHNYYKAPDLIGPALSRHWNIPYVLIEATRAKSRLTGPWADFAARAEAASDAAQLIFHVTERDLFALERDRPEGQMLAALPPFLNRQALPEPASGAGPILSVGMMRPGDKLASYALIAQTLDALSDVEWHLEIVGDGPARPEVAALFSAFGPRVRLVGALDANGVAAAYQNASIFLWPGVNEAFGMVYLEAQAAGLPIVAQDRPGVRDVLAPSDYPSVDEGAAGLARRLDAFLRDPALRDNAAQAARDHIRDRHLLPSAARRLHDTLTPLIGQAA